jgi:hypothetical protein
MFVHSGWMHIIGNMFFLIIFGRPVERAIGSVKFGAAYVLAMFAALGAHSAIAPAPTMPVVGRVGCHFGNAMRLTESLGFGLAFVWAFADGVSCIRIGYFRCPRVRVRTWWKFGKTDRRGKRTIQRQVVPLVRGKSRGAWFIPIRVMLDSRRRECSTSGAAPFPATG